MEISYLKKELDSFTINKAWEIVDKPTNRNTVKSKWALENQKESKLCHINL